MLSSIFKRDFIKWDLALIIEEKTIILLVNNCTAHADINGHLTNIYIEFLPTNTTSVLQP